MADNLTTATIDVRGNTRGLEKDILKALKTVEFSQINTKKSSQALGRITGQVSEFNKSLEASNARVIAFGASAGAIFAVERAFASLISSTIEVEKKLTDINVLLNASSSTLQKFGDSLFGIARNTAQSFSDVADAATELARQGLGIEETLKRTNAALILTRLSGLDAKSSVEALTATLNSFSSSALDAVEVVNKLANVDAAFAVSSADLANAISRVGSTAVDAGVSLDELIALVTSAQQTTARGGSVIGNSFKTIFTRLQRGKVRDLLGSLGVDTSEGQSAISLLQQLANTYDNLGAVQKSYIAEQVGGVFQINILKAALSDLGKEYSIYGRALDTSLSSTDQAIRRNELLNQTISALSSQAYANLEQAASKIGSLVFEPNAKGFLSGFNDLLSSFNNIDAESAGGKLMAGFFKGIGDFIGGPGAVLATAVLVKLFSRLAQFAAGSAKELLGTNKAAQQQAAIEQSILSILQKNSQFTSQILSGKMTTVQAEKELLNYLTAQSNILREQERLSKVIGANLRMAGVSVGASGIPMVAAAGKGKKAASSGYVPNFATDQAIGQALENAGARQHGYKAGKAKKTTIHDGNGKSFKSFVNSKEDVKTFTNAAGKKATIVRPPNGFGKNTEYAAGGFIPSFAKNAESIRRGVDFEKRLNKALKGSASFSPNAPMDFPLPTGYGSDYEARRAIGISDASVYGDAKLTRSRKSEQSLLDKYLRTSEGSKDFRSARETDKGFLNLKPKGLSMLFSGAGSDSRGISYISTVNTQLSSGAKKLIESRFGKKDKKSRTLAMPYIADKIDERALSSFSSGFIPNFGKMQDFYKNLKEKEGTDDVFNKRAKQVNAATKKGAEVKDLGSLPYTMIHAGGGGNFQSSASYLKKDKKTNKETRYLAKIWTAGLDQSKLGGANVQKRVGDALVTEANNLSKIFNPSGGSQFSNYNQLSNTGSVFSAAGTVFESAIRSAFNVPAQGQSDRIDFPNPSGQLRSFFNNAPGSYEAKIENNDNNRSSALAKYIAINSLAKGYVPNFKKIKSKFGTATLGKTDKIDLELFSKTLGKKINPESIASIEDLTANKPGAGAGLYSDIASSINGKQGLFGYALAQDRKVSGDKKKDPLAKLKAKYPQIIRRIGLGGETYISGDYGRNVVSVKSLKDLEKNQDSILRMSDPAILTLKAFSGGFIPNFLDVAKGKLPIGVRGRTNYGSGGSKTNIQLGAGAEESTLAHELFHSAYSRSTFDKARSNGKIGKYISNPSKYAGSGFLIGDQIFKNLNKNNLIKSLGLNPIQLDFDGKNPSASYSGEKAVDEIITRIQEKIFKNKGDLDSLSLDEKSFAQNLQGLGIISNKRLSNVSRRSKEGSKFRSLVENKFSSIASSGLVPNFASQSLISEINKRILNPNVAQKLKEGQGLKDEAYIKAASRLGVNIAGLEKFMPALGFPLKGKDSIKKVSSALGFGFGRSFAIDALKMGDWEYVKSSFEKNGLTRSDFDKLSQFAKTPKGETAFRWGFKSKAGGYIPNFANIISSTRDVRKKANANQSSLNTFRIVHPLNPKIDAQGRVSFPDLEKKAKGSVKIIHNEGMEGQNIFTLPSFLDFVNSRGNKETFFRRNSFDYVLSSAGYIPNFADALNKAISRERAAGLSKNQIYVDQHDSLKNKSNPMGLMVANTRDEPMGGIQGIKRAKKEGKNPKKYGAASSGFIPNFAPGKIQPSKDYLDAMNEAMKYVALSTNKASSSVKKFDKEISDSADSVDRSSKKQGKLGKIGSFLKDNSMSLGFGLQVAASMAGEYAGNDDTKPGRTTKAVAGGIGDIASFTGTGAMIAGPWGAAAGFAVGLGKAAFDVSKALTTKLPDLEKALQVSSDSMNRFGESGQKILQLNEQYMDALSSGGDPAKAADLMMKNQQAYAEELSKLTEAQRSSMISAIAQGRGQEGYAKVLAELQDSAKAQESALVFQKYTESAGLFGGPDKKIVEGIDKSLVQDLTKGLDAASIQSALDNVANVLGDSAVGTEKQALALMRSLASSGSLSSDQKANFEKVINSFADAASQTDLSKVAEGFLKGVIGKPKAFEDIKKLQEAAKASAEAEAEKRRKEIEIREKANASLLKLQAETESVYQRFNNSIEDFISTMETSAELRSNSGEFKGNFYSEAGAPSAAENQKEKNILRANSDKLNIDVYKTQFEASNNFRKGVESLLEGVSADAAKLRIGEVATSQENELLGIKSSLEQALLPVQQMLLGGQYEAARVETQKVLGGLNENQKSAVGQDKLIDIGNELDRSIQESARKQDLIYKNSQKDLAIQAQQLVFQRAMTKLTQAQNFGGAGIKDIIKDSPESAFNQAIGSLNDLKTLGFNQKDLKQGKESAVRGGDANSYGIRGEKPNAAMSGALVDFYNAASQISGEPVLSTQSKDFGALTQAVSDQIRKKLEELKVAGEGVVDPVVFARIESTLATLGGSDKVSQLKIMKDLGVADVGGKQILDEALKSFTGGAFAGLSPDLKKAFESTTDEGAGATLLLIAGQQKQTDSLSQGLAAVTAAGIESNSLLAAQPDAIATAIGAILEKGRAETAKNEATQAVGKLDEEWKKTGKQISSNSTDIEKAQKESSAALSVLGDIPAGLSKQDFIKQQEASIDKAELEKAKSLVGNYAKQEELSGSDKFNALFSGIGNSIVTGSAGLGELMSFGQFDFGSSFRRQAAEKDFARADSDPKVLEEEYNKALALIQKNTALETFKQQEEVVSSKQKENEGLSKKRVDIESQQVEASKKSKQAFDQFQQASQKAAISQNLMTTGAGSGYITEVAATKAANEKSLADALAMDNLAKTERQKQAVSRSTGRETMFNPYSGQQDTYENVAVTKFGGANAQAFAELRKQNVLPSLEKFSEVYKSMGVEGGAKAAFQKLKGETYGVQKTPVKPAALPPEQQKQITPQQQKQNQEELQRQTNNQQESSQVVNSILASVNQIAQAILNPQQQPTSPEAKPIQGSSVSNAGVNVSAPVSLTVNANAQGGGGEQATAIAEQIKIGLSSFLSSPEFIGKVTSIANQAAGNITPPKV